MYFFRLLKKARVEVTGTIKGIERTGIVMNRATGAPSIVPVIATEMGE